MYEWYVLYCNNQDVERITRRVEGLDVEVFCPRYIKVTPRKDPRQLTVNGHHQSAHKVSTIQYGLQQYFTQSLIQHGLSLLHNPVLISLMPKTGFARMAQKELLNISPSLIV